jgi:MFS family permease
LKAYRAALRRRDLRLLFGGLLISSTGNWAYNVALLAYVFEKTHSLGWVGAAGLVRFLPSVLLSAYAGVIAERFERVRVMASADLICMVIQAALAAVAFAGGPPAVVVALAGLAAIAGLIYYPAVASMIPQVAREDELAAANALEGTLDNLTSVTGPAIGAALLALSSPGWVFLINAVSFGASALIVSRMQTRGRAVDVTEEGKAGPFEQMLVGVRTIVHSP